MIVLGMVVMGLRRGGLFTDPKLWAEDGVIFWSDSRRFPLWTTIFHPYDGYLHVVPRILAAFTALFPIGFTPVMFAGLAVVATTLACSLVLRPEIGWLIPSYPVRVVVFFGFVILPGAGSEVNGTLTGIEEYLAAALLVLSLSRDPAVPWARRLLLPATAVMGLTGPFTPVLAPAFWFRAWRSRTRYSVAMAGTVTGCAAIMMTVLVLSGTGSSEAHQILGIFSADWVVTGHNAVLGTFGSLLFGRSVLTSLWTDPTLHFELWLGCLVMLGLAVLACRDLPRSVALGLAIAMAGSVVSVIYRLPGGWANLGNLNLGNRYYALPVEIVIVVLGISLAKRTGRSSRVGWLLAAAPVLLTAQGCLLGLPLTALPSIGWANSVSCLDTGSVCTIPVDPPGWTVYMSESPHALQAFCDKINCGG